MMTVVYSSGKLVSLKDALDGCERILHDEFKDYPESALYMIGTVGEAKENAPPEKPGDKSELETNPAAKDSQGLAADSNSEAQPEPQPKPKQEVEHAAGTHES